MSPKDFDRQFLDVVEHEGQIWSVLCRMEVRSDGDHITISLVHSMRTDDDGIFDHKWALIAERRNYSDVIPAERQVAESSMGRVVDAFVNLSRQNAEDRVHYAGLMATLMAGAALNGDARGEV